MELFRIDKNIMPTKIKILKKEDKCLKQKIGILDEKGKILIYDLDENSVKLSTTFYISFVSPYCLTDISQGNFVVAGLDLHKTGRF
jgi:hypothetical protein